jgi:transposase-like protein
MVQRMAGPEAITATSLAKEVGVSQNTLSRWLREARTLGSMGKRSTHRGARPDGARRWSAEAKLRVVIEASGLKDEELGAFLRREGLHEAQLEEWRSKALGAAAEALRDTKKKKAEQTPEARKVRELERELLRKDRALAKVAALLALKKKVQEIWGDGEDDTPSRRET